MKHKISRPVHLHPDTYLYSALVLFIVVMTGFILAYTTMLCQNRERRVVCSQETYTCPNGSAVSRSGPECQFTACPTDVLPNRPGITEEPFEVPSATITVTPEQKEKKAPTTKQKGVLCTQEVRLCSDGSFVGKVAPTCEFAPCPDDLELDSDR